MLTSIARPDSAWDQERPGPVLLEIARRVHGLAWKSALRAQRKPRTAGAPSAPESDVQRRAATVQPR